MQKRRRAGKTGEGNEVIAGRGRIIDMAWKQFRWRKQNYGLAEVVKEPPTPGMVLDIPPSWTCLSCDTSKVGWILMDFGRCTAAGLMTLETGNFPTNHRANFLHCEGQVQSSQPDSLNSGVTWWRRITKGQRWNKTLTHQMASPRTTGRWGQWWGLPQSCSSG